MVVRAEVPAVGRNPGSRADLWQFFFRGRENLFSSGVLNNQSVEQPRNTGQISAT